ncbi:hypothetical protein [Streptomyces sp. NPDC004014]
MESSRTAVRAVTAQLLVEAGRRRPLSGQTGMIPDIALRVVGVLFGVCLPATGVLVGYPGCQGERSGRRAPVRRGGGTSDV